MRIALLGYGTVGSGIGRIVETHDLGIEIAKILCLPKECDEPRKTSSYDEILAEPDLDVIVEAMGGQEPAHTFIMQALERGISVVTANKAVVAAHLGEFVGAAKASGAGLYVEASCGGGIPWLASIAKVKRIDAIDSFSGILNGTTNFIIDQMKKNDEDFSEALSRAQELGYAERDPSADIDGIDVANKCIITASLAFGCDCIRDLPVFGIRNLTAADLAHYAYEGYGVKLLARGICRDGRYAVAVEPVLVPSDSLEANVPDNFNIATLEGATVGPLKFYGQGAGSLPTGNACVQDLLDCRDGNQLTFDLDPSITYDPELLTGDYVIRTTAAFPQGGTAFGIGSKRYKGLTADAAHKLMRTIVADDPSAFMACIPTTL